MAKLFPLPSRVTLPNCLVRSMWNACHLPSLTPPPVPDTRILMWPVPMSRWRNRWPSKSSNPKKCPDWKSSWMWSMINNHEHEILRLTLWIHRVNLSIFVNWVKIIFGHLVQVVSWGAMMVLVLISLNGCVLLKAAGERGTNEKCTDVGYAAEQTEEENY